MLITKQISTPRYCDIILDQIVTENNGIGLTRTNRNNISDYFKGDTKREKSKEKDLGCSLATPR